MSELDPRHEALLARYRRATTNDPAAVERGLDALLADPRAGVGLVPGPRRAWLGVGGAMVSTVALVLLVLALRPRPTTPPRASDVQPSTAAVVEADDPVETIEPAGHERHPNEALTVPAPPRPATASAPNEPEVDPPKVEREREPKVKARQPALGPSEIELMVEARQALRAREYGAALAVLETHQRMFPAGQLRDERDISRVIALCHLGRRADADALVAAVDTQAARAAARSIQGCVDPGTSPE